jgi:hypothetical protein
MLIRPYTPADLAEIRGLHTRLGFDYKMPDLNSPLFVCKTVVEHELEIKMAAVLKIQAEAYLWLDPEWGTPRERWMSLQLLHENMRAEADSMGIEEVMCCIPPELEARFAKRLKSMKWQKDREWPTWTRTIKE